MQVNKAGNAAWQVTPTPAPSRRLRVLHIEDSDDDAALVRRELERGGFEVDVLRVETRAAMQKALKDRQWDVIISDHSLPTFSAPEAFAVLREMGLDLPFIMVSGTIGEEFAIEAMRTGIHDFVLKGNLRRLATTVEREVREAALRDEQRKTRQQLLISERMASVGTLAAGVGHEINNPLAVVIGNLECVIQDVARLAEILPVADGRATPPPPATVDPARAQHAAKLVSGIRETLDDMREAAGQVGAIVRDLRLFSRIDEDTRGPVDIVRVLDSSLRMARNEIRHRAEVVREYGEVPAVHGNEGRLSQVFLNLLVNAAQALPDGRVDRNTITLRTQLVAGAVAVEVSDTGTGIPPEILPHIFDLFFTTKPIGVGTGLGLAICHRIVTSMGGEMSVESHVGKGTTFRVLLPAEQAPAAIPAAKPLLARRDRPPASILVVEDEDAVRRMLQRLLPASDKITFASGGKEALERLAAGDQYDVIISDLMMPGMSGMELHAAIAERSAELARRIIFLTGGAFTPGARAFLDGVANFHVEKPIDTGLLLETIEAVLTSPKRTIAERTT